MDIVIPIVFPDYKISVEIKKTEVDIFPSVDFDNFTIPRVESKWSNLGHAGVLFIQGATGNTKYYEYGRYDSTNLGLVVKFINLPNAAISNGSVEHSSLKRILSSISNKSGQAGRIKGVYIQVDNKFQAMLNHAETRKKQNADPKRKPYDLTTNSCLHFVKEIVASAGVKPPWAIDPRPNAYIGEFRDEFPDLDFEKGILTIEGIGRF